MSILDTSTRTLKKLDSHSPNPRVPYSSEATPLTRRRGNMGGKLSSWHGDAPQLQSIPPYTITANRLSSAVRKTIGVFYVDTLHAHRRGVAAISAKVESPR